MSVDEQEALEALIRQLAEKDLVALTVLMLISAAAIRQLAEAVSALFLKIYLNLLSHKYRFSWLFLSLKPF